MRTFPNFPEPRAAAVRYDATTGLVTVDLKGGGSFDFAASDRPELASHTAPMLAGVVTDHIGFYIHWPATHVSLYVPALLLLGRTI